MAKYTITHSCGHVEEVNLFGRSSERDNRIQWLEAIGLCSNCFSARRQQQREKSSSDAEKWASDNLLPTLQGSEKQCAWAETIRREKLERIASIASRIDSPRTIRNLCDQILCSETRSLEFVDAINPFLDAIRESPLAANSWGILGDWMAEQGDARSEAMHAVYWLLQQDQAKWWIDNRYQDGMELASIKAREPEQLAKEEAARLARANAAAKIEQEKREKQQRICDLKDSFSCRIVELFGKPCGYQVWNKSDKRVYVGGFGNSLLEYYFTGHGKHRPGTLYAESAIKEYAARSSKSIEESTAAFRLLCEDLCKAWNTLHVRQDEFPKVGA